LRGAVPANRPRRVLAAAAVIVVLLVVFLVMSRVRGSSHAGSPAGNAPLADTAPPGAVLLVPGYGGSTEGLATLARVLRAAGRTVAVVRIPGQAEQSFAAQAVALEAAVVAQEKAGRAPVDIVAHSNGGVLARFWARHHDGAHRARRIVTLGSPHHGTQLAAVAAAEAPDLCPEACQEVRPDSAFLRALNSGDETPAGTDWVSVFTDLDDVVTPVATSALGGGVNIRIQDVCADARPDHGGLVTDPAVVGLVLDEVGALPVHAEPPSACARLRSLAG
jgi:triacylglycerol esterase/lipase EstA (alpha/beta hydrolase family)